MYAQVARINYDVLKHKGVIEGNEKEDKDVYAWFSLLNNPKAKSTELKTALNKLRTELTNYFSKRGYVVDIQTFTDFFLNTDEERTLLDNHVDIDIKGDPKNKKKVNFRAKFSFYPGDKREDEQGNNRVWLKVVLELAKQFSGFSYSFTTLDKKRYLEYELVVKEVSKNYNETDFVVALETIDEAIEEQFGTDYYIRID